MSKIDQNKIFGSFKDQLNKETIKDIESLYDKIDQHSEFEFMFFNYKNDQNAMNLENFLKILEYIS